MSIHAWTGFLLILLALSNALQMYGRWRSERRRRPRMPHPGVQDPGYDAQGVYTDKWGSKCVCGQCRPPQVINCDLLARVREAQEILRRRPH